MSSDIDLEIYEWYVFQIQEDGLYRISSEEAYIWGSIYRLMADGNSLIQERMVEGYFEGCKGSTYCVRLSTYGSWKNSYYCPVQFSKENPQEIQGNRIYTDRISQNGEVPFCFNVAKDGYYSVCIYNEENEDGNYIDIYKQQGFEEWSWMWVDDMDEDGPTSKKIYMESGKYYFFFEKPGIVQLKITRNNKYEYYDYAQCMSFIASGGTINYVENSTEKTWEFNTDKFINQNDKWTPVRHLYEQYMPQGETYQFAYDSLKEAEYMYKPLEQLYVMKADNVFEPVQCNDITGEGDAILIARFVGTKEVGKTTETKPADIQPTKVNINYKKIKMQAGTKFKWLSASVYPANASNKTLSWKTSNSKVALVDANGVIKAKKSGKATITATAANGKNVSVKVTVVKNPIKVTSVTLNKKKAVIKKGKKIKLKAIITPVNAANKKLVWSTSDKSIATVNNKGVVTAKKAGKVKITCAAQSNNKKKKVCVITVKNK